MTTPVPVRLAQDRSIAVKPNRVIKTGWIDINLIKMACSSRMSAGDVKDAYERLLQMDDEAAWPPPNGFWEGREGKSRFVIQDGRHEYIASQMLGRARMFVAWLVEA